MTFPRWPARVSVYCREYGPEPNAAAAHAVPLQSGTPPVVGIEPDGATVLDAVGMEIVIVVIPGLPIGFDIVKVLVTSAFSPMFA
jgi:hypothetical protein